MINFDNFVPDGNIPIYLQLPAFIKKGIIAGEITDGDELPSRRVLSATLGINPNTVQKAFKQLEDEGLIESRLGAKSCITVNAGIIRQIKDGMISEEIKTVIASLKQMAVSKSEALELIERNWDDEK